MQMRATTPAGGYTGSPSKSGFSLIELLVVIGIISVLIALLLPCLASARRQAQLVQCASNERQICLSLIAYASDNYGFFPPNQSATSPGIYWCDSDRIGNYIPGLATIGTGLGGGVMVCPDDEGSMRSYSMNIWASGDVDGTVKAYIPQLGQLWKTNVSSSSDMILVFERWSSSGSTELGYYAPPMAGEAGTTPGERFGTEGGITPPINAGRFGLVPCEMQYTRHVAASKMFGGLSAPTGALNIGYADGHVQACRQDDLANLSTGHAIGSTMWSPSDPSIPQ